MSSVNERKTVPEAGWYAALDGNRPDRLDWLEALCRPFDPFVVDLGDNECALRSSQFDDAVDAPEVRARAIPMIARLNGAMAVWRDSQPLRFGGIIFIDEDGGRSMHVFAEFHGVARARMSAKCVVRGPNGEVRPPTPPQPSMPQRWLESSDHDLVADLLEYAGRFDDWYEIYKALEVADRLAGNKRRLKALLGQSAADVDNMRRTANFYRHARAPRPEILTPIVTAGSLAKFVVRTVLAARSGHDGGPISGQEPEQ